MGQFRRRSSVGLLIAVLCLSACLDTGETTDTPSAFDPPSSFDLTRTVSLTEDEARNGTLHGTTLFSVSDGVLGATDLADDRPLWSTELPADSEQDYLRPPFVVGGTVVVATGEYSKDVTRENNCIVNIFGVDASTGVTLWEIPVPIYTIAYPQFGLDFSERDGQLLVTMGLQMAPFSTMLLDPGTGDLRWQADVLLIAATTGRYAVAAPADHHHFTTSYAVALDMDTGEVGAQLTEAGSTLPVSYVDPYGDRSYITFSTVNHDDSSNHDDFSERFFRFSSADATVEPFTPAEGDICYLSENSCQLEEGQTVVLCQVGSFDVAYGVDAASGQVLWPFDESYDQRLENATQFHGNVYGRLGGAEHVVVSLDTGEIIERSLDVDPGTVTTGLTRLKSAKLNEYGAIGTPNDKDVMERSLNVWVPASG